MLQSTLTVFGAQFTLAILPMGRCELYTTNWLWRSQIIRSRTLSCGWYSAQSPWSCWFVARGHPDTRSNASGREFTARSVVMEYPLWIPNNVCVLWSRCSTAHILRSNKSQLNEPSCVVSLIRIIFSDVAQRHKAGLVRTQNREMRIKIAIQGYCTPAYSDFRNR